MPPSKKDCTDDLVKFFVLTSDELDVVRKILQQSDERRKKSTMAAMTAFVKRHSSDSKDFIRSRWRCWVNSPKEQE